MQKGSHISISIADHFASMGYFKKRNELFFEGVIENNEFIMDYLFDKPSQASSVILGSNTNGNVEWLTIDGTTIQKIDKKGLVSYSQKESNLIIKDLIRITKTNIEEELKTLRIDLNNLLKSIQDEKDFKTLLSIRDRINLLEKWEPSVESLTETVKRLFDEYREESYDEI